jgi:opacity protein-like surface antigen
MKKTLLLSAVAVIALASAGIAADLPKKKKTEPAAAAPVVSAVPTEKPVQVASADTTIALGFGMESNDGVYDTANKYAYKVAVERNIGGGAFVGGNFQTSQTQPNNGAIKQNIEVIGGYKLPMGPVSVKGSLGVGERYTDGNNFSYYVARAGADYKLTDSITLNAAQYRYRNAFDTTNNYQSHQIGTGMTFNYTQNQAIYANVYRNLDSGFNVTDKGVEMGLKVSF